ncbi:hypothetical protein HQ563_02085 [bacterium]|nr:hypothetical protein [bacterium]
MKKWFVLLLSLAALQAEGMVPLPQLNVPIKTDVKVKSSKDRNRKNQYSRRGLRTSVQKDTAQRVFLSIEVRNMSPKVIRDMTISYQLYELQFERSTGKRLVLTRRLGQGEKLVAAGRGQLTIPQLKPLEKKVVESKPLETRYRSTLDTRKFVSQTKTTGTKFGGYIVEYSVGGRVVKRDASSRRLHEAYLRSIRPPGSSTGLRMNIRK